ncbi:hypothetical protein MD484_g4840, partial [Candolleomyces efflorescens]
MSTPSASDSHSIESSGKIEKDKGIMEKLPPSEYDVDTEGRTLEKEAAVSKEDVELERRARLKLDWTLLPVMTMFYLLSFLDRANIGNARVAGLQTALGLTDTQYQICVTILYVPYILAELPANLLLRRIGPNILMPTILTAWGLVVTFQVSVISAWWSDRYNTRGVPLIAISLLSIAGWAIFLSANQKFVLYGALYLMVPGIYGLSPVTCAWVANNSEPYYRRASSIAIGFMATNAGGILSTWRFPTKEGPKFTKTAIMNLVFACVMIIFTLLNMLYLHTQNQRKTRHRHEILKPYATDEEPEGGVRAWVELGDKHPDFKYTL